MKVDIHDVRETVLNWNRLNDKYQKLSGDVMNWGETGPLREEMGLIEEACVARHISSPESQKADSKNALEEIISRSANSNIRSSLQEYNDNALVILQAKLSQIIAAAYKSLTENIYNKASVTTNQLSENERNEREAFLDHHIIPFLSVLYVEKICNLLGSPHNIYVSSNLRSFFAMQLQISINQIYGEDITRSDVDILINNYRDSSYDMKELLSGNSIPLRDRLYGRGIINPASITEEFCTAITDAFSAYMQDCDSICTNLLNP